jgi:hypothetical protein
MSSGSAPIKPVALKESNLIENVLKKMTCWLPICFKFSEADNPPQNSANYR